MWDWKKVTSAYNKVANSDFVNQSLQSLQDAKAKVDTAFEEAMKQNAGAEISQHSSTSSSSAAPRQGDHVTVAPAFDSDFPTFGQAHSPPRHPRPPPPPPKGALPDVAQERKPVKNENATKGLFDDDEFDVFMLGEGDTSQWRPQQSAPPSDNSMSGPPLPSSSSGGSIGQGGLPRPSSAAEEVDLLDNDLLSGDENAASNEFPTHPLPTAEDQLAQRRTDQVVSYGPAITGVSEQTETGESTTEEEFTGLHTGREKGDIEGSVGQPVEKQTRLNSQPEPPSDPIQSERETDQTVAKSVRNDKSIVGRVEEALVVPPSEELLDLQPTRIVAPTAGEVLNERSPIVEEPTFYSQAWESQTDQPRVPEETDITSTINNERGYGARAVEEAEATSALRSGAEDSQRSDKEDNEGHEEEQRGAGVERSDQDEGQTRLIDATTQPKPSPEMQASLGGWSLSEGLSEVDSFSRASREGDAESQEESTSSPQIPATIISTNHDEPELAQAAEKGYSVEVEPKVEEPSTGLEAEGALSKGSSRGSQSSHVSMSSTSEVEERALAISSDEGSEAVNSRLLEEADHAGENHTEELVVMGDESIVPVKHNNEGEGASPTYGVATGLRRCLDVVEPLAAIEKENQPMDFIVPDRSIKEEKFNTTEAAEESHVTEVAPVTEEDHATEVAPATEEDHATEVAPATEEDHATEVAPATEEDHATEVAPATEEDHATEVAPATEEDHATEVAPATEEDHATEVAPATEEDHATEVAPATEEDHATEVAPATEEDHATEVAPATEEDHATEVAPATEESHVTEVAPATEEGHATEVAPVTEEDHATEVAPATEEGHATEVAPATEEDHATEVAPVTEEDHATEVAPATEEGHATEVARVTEEDHGTEVAPATEESHCTELAPATEESHGTEVAPATEKSHATEVAPATEESHGTEVAPATEESHGTEVAPVTEEDHGTEVAPATEESHCTELAPATEESHGTEVAPATEESHTAEVAPATEKSHATEVAPATEESHATEVAPATEESHATEVAPATEESHTAEVAPATEKSHTAEVAPATEKSHATEVTSAANNATKEIPAEEESSPVDDVEANLADSEDNESVVRETWTDLQGGANAVVLEAAAGMSANYIRAHHPTKSDESFQIESEEEEKVEQAEDNIEPDQPEQVGNDHAAARQADKPDLLATTQTDSDASQGPVNVNENIASPATSPDEEEHADRDGLGAVARGLMSVEDLIDTARERASSTLSIGKAEKESGTEGESIQGDELSKGNAGGEPRHLVLGEESPRAEATSNVEEPEGQQHGGMTEDKPEVKEQLAKIEPDEMPEEDANNQAIISELLSEIEDLKARLHSREEQLEAHAKTMQMLLDEGSKSGVNEEVLRDLENKYCAATEELHEAKAVATTREKQITKLQEELVKQSKDAEDAKEETQRILEEGKKLAQKLSNLEQKHKARLQQLDAAKKEKEKLQAQLEEAQQKSKNLGDASAESAALREQMQKDRQKMKTHLAGVVADKTKAEDDLAKAKERVNQYQREKGELLSGQKLMQAELDRVSAELSAAQNELLSSQRQHSEQVDKLQTELEETQHALAQQESAGGSYSSVAAAAAEQRAVDAETKCDSLHVDLANARKELAEARGKLGSSTTNTERLKRDISALNAELEAMKADQATKATDEAHLSSALEEVNRLQDQLRQKDLRISEVVEKLKNSDAEKRANGEQLRTMQVRTDELQRQLESAQKAFNDTQSTGRRNSGQTLLESSSPEPSFTRGAASSSSVSPSGESQLEKRCKELERRFEISLQALGQLQEELDQSKDVAAMYKSMLKKQVEEETS